MESKTLTQQENTTTYPPPCYEVYADGRRIYSGCDCVDSLNACFNAGRLYNARWVEYWVDGQRWAWLMTTKKE